MPAVAADAHVVVVGLAPPGHPYVGSGAQGKMDPRDKPEDDTSYLPLAQSAAARSPAAELCIEGERRLQEHLGAGGTVLHRAALGLVVAEAVLAGHEDHGGGRYL